MIVPQNVVCQFFITLKKLLGTGRACHGTHVAVTTLYRSQFSSSTPWILRSNSGLAVAPFTGWATTTEKWFTWNICSLVLIRCLPQETFCLPLLKLDQEQRWETFIFSSTCITNFQRAQWPNPGVVSFEFSPEFSGPSSGICHVVSRPCLSWEMTENSQIGNVTSTHVNAVTM